MNRTERIERLHAALAERVLVIDGAMGTAIQAVDLTAADFGGEAFEGCNENLNLTRPDTIEAIHRAHLAAGADIIETNTFGSADLVLAEYPPLEKSAHEITVAATRLARRVADQAATSERPRFVAGSMGPTTKAISVTGGVTFRRLIETFRDQAIALIEGGADYLLLETQQDTRNVKAGLLGIEQAFERAGERIPVAVSGTIEPMGTMLGGQTAEALTVSMQHAGLLYLGLNCATGPDFMTDHLRAISELAQTHVACVPNAGLPDEDGHYLESPDMVAGVLERFVNEGWINVVGGCCGTTEQHVAALSAMVAGRKPRTVPTMHRTLVSGLEMTEFEESNRPLLVGERTNSLGSRRFKRLIADGKYEEASEIARKQVRGGAQIIDLCLQDPDRDELQDMRQFLDHVVRKVKVPLMIDSTDAAVVADALTYSQGKSIINSINLEDGLERFDEVVPLARRFGAALIVGCIDEDKEQGMAVTRERKLEIALRSHDLLVERYGVPSEDIIFDPLVFPCGTGDANYIGSARETIEGVSLIKAALPLCKTVLGVSNVSFGLPAAGREVLNSVFLYHCTRAGLDMAIVNTQKLERYASISDDEKEFANRVLFHGEDEDIAAFAEHFRGRKARAPKDTVKLSLDERLADYIITGTKEGLIADIDLKLNEAAPLDIINGPLMTGMAEVGRLFNNNELIVAEVLQSAEAMKAAVQHLEPKMEKDASASRGRILLATVKGDVHDIGKNLVEIILSNNGYDVINLGIKVPPQDLIHAIEEHSPDLVGLSGLLVKSAQQMIVTAKELSVHGTCPPMLVGGAALTSRFARKRIAPVYDGLTVYAKDAMEGLALANRIQDESERPALLADLAEEERRLTEHEAKKQAAPKRSSPTRVVAVDAPVPPDLKRHVLKQLPLHEVWSYINPRMLYGKHLGLKGDPDALFESGDEKALGLRRLIEELQGESREGGAAPMHARAIWQFFPASALQDTLRLHDPVDPARIAATFDLPRQDHGSHRCLADYVRGPGDDGQPTDWVSLFVVTAGEGVRARYQAFKDAGDYLKSHAIQALAIETAEAAAEWLHHKLRGQWGFADAPGTSMLDRFRARYRGKRYSFGYPACPDLAMQAPLFELLHPDEIGVTLTEEFMMEPEASVSALVLHHPDAQYFAAGD